MYSGTSNQTTVVYLKESVGIGVGQGQAVLPFDIWLHNEIILFSTILASWCNS